ncbi:(d)CMP kinase [Pseudoalteromonas sp. OOF1S-7]|uniref:(d)CMP kinase n=1 Tax=Pseudoalteromonas sp. OOF1S-7 TaxID=2917757 RepID=UPI001EF52042|nr:(d)CMP kinase [Pseudoalteromonas sp. OOF1S-7]MCG7534974.1 (d)CMP kinase [Pseudoalteromonas sp. OOF1S-7]
MIVTIDGPAGSGKTTVAIELSKLTNFKCILSGNMFRGIAYYIMDNKISLDDPCLVALCKAANFEFTIVNGVYRTKLNGYDITDSIESPSILPLTSKVALNAGVRAELVKKQRDMARVSDVIVEGRDSGTVVFPNADIKFYLNADMGTRVDRLYSLLPEDKKDHISKEEFFKEITEVDELDASRKIAPLRVPEGAIVHKNYGELSASQDAIILYYYLTRKGEILKNSQVLSSVNRKQERAGGTEVKQATLT